MFIPPEEKEGQPASGGRVGGEQSTAAQDSPEPQQNAAK